MTPHEPLVFVRGNRFHQGHQLTLDGLILDLGVGPQQPKAPALRDFIFFAALVIQ
jgi:hypothetical protein